MGDATVVSEQSSPDPLMMVSLPKHCSLTWKCPVTEPGRSCVLSHQALSVKDEALRFERGQIIQWLDLALLRINFLVGKENPSGVWKEQLLLGEVEERGFSNAMVIKTYGPRLVSRC